MDMVECITYIPHLINIEHVLFAIDGQADILMGIGKPFRTVDEWDTVYSADIDQTALVTGIPSSYRIFLIWVCFGFRTAFGTPDREFDFHYLSLPGPGSSSNHVVDQFPMAHSAERTRPQRFVFCFIS